MLVKNANIFTCYICLKIPKKGLFRKYLSVAVQSKIEIGKFSNSAIQSIVSFAIKLNIIGKIHMS